MIHRKPLIAHVLYRFDVGGLENGVVNLINRLPGFDHAVVALTDVTDFKQRINRNDVRYISLHKPPGHGLAIYRKLYTTFRQLRPTIVHTRNLAAMEAQLPAALAGVPVRIHGEHGWDVQDLNGSRKSYLWQRRLLRPFIHRFVALSGATENYLTEKVGIAKRDVRHLYNGVDTQRFHPALVRRPLADMPFSREDLFIVGTVGRLQVVKDQLTLARGFVRAIELSPGLRSCLRLVIAGDGPLLAELEAILDAGHCRELAWLPGVRDDVPELMRSLDLFVLPSLAEGLSNTILEAMASGLPVVATRVGGNPELVVDGQSGTLIPPADVEVMARVLTYYANEPAIASAQGQAGRKIAEQNFSINTMVANYTALYNDALASQLPPQQALCFWRWF